jgi:hypothetical protein
VWKGCFIVRLFLNALKCASTVLECRCCRIHRYVAAPCKRAGNIHCWCQVMQHSCDMILLGSLKDTHGSQVLGKRSCDVILTKGQRRATWTVTDRSHRVNGRKTTWMGPGKGQVVTWHDADREPENNMLGTILLLYFRLLPKDFNSWLFTVLPYA